MSTLTAPQTITTDRDQNTRMLMEVPGLSETITPQLGNCIFVPGLPEDDGKDYRFLTLDIDGQDQLFYKPCHAADRQSLSVESGEAFNVEGAAHLFRHVGGIPVAYKAAALSLALHRQDDDLLNIAFTPEEQEQLVLGLDHIARILGPATRMVMPQLIQHVRTGLPS